MIATARGRGCVFCVVVWVLFGASLVSAQAPIADATGTASQVAASLAYSRGEGADTCPDEAALKEAVHRQLGYPVFGRTPVTRALDVSVVRLRGRLVARLALRSETGDALGAREIESRGSTCDELADALGLAIALALDPTPMMPVKTEPSANAAAPTTPTVPECPAAVPCPEPVVCPVCPTPVPDTEAPVAWKAGLGAALGFGALPTLAPALAIDVGLRIGAIELLLEGIVYAEVAHVVAATPLETQAQAARLGVCRWLLTGADVEVAACVIGGLGVLRGSSDAAVDRSLTFLATAGTRAAAELRLWGPVWLSVRADLHTNLAGTTLSLGDTRLWETPAQFLELAMLGVVRFL